MSIAGNLLESEFEPGEETISESIFFKHGGSTTNWLPILDSSGTEIVRTYILDANGAGNFGFECGNGAGARYGMALKIVIEEIFLEQWLKAEDIIRDYYANVLGRIGDDNTADQIIGHILVNELKIGGTVEDIMITDNPYMFQADEQNWIYDFTIDKKVIKIIKPGFRWCHRISKRYIATK